MTPSLNQQEFIDDTIQTVLAQAYPRVEHLIIDAGSTDGTLNVVARHGHVRCISEPDEGQADAVNKGFRMAQGDILGWLNSDDIYMPGAFHRVAAYFEAHPEVDVVYGDCAEIDARGVVQRTIAAHPVDLARLLLLDFTLYQPSFFFRRSAVERLGPLNQRLHLALDYEYIIRAVTHCQVRYLPHTLAAFRRHPDAKTTLHPERFLDEYLAVLTEVFADPALPADIVSIRRRAFRNAYLSCGQQSLVAGRTAEARGWLVKSLMLSRNPFQFETIKAGILLADIVLGFRVGQRLVALAGEIRRGAVRRARCAY